MARKADGTFEYLNKTNFSSGVMLILRNSIEGSLTIMDLTPSEINEVLGMTREYTDKVAEFIAKVAKDRGLPK